MLKVTVNFDDNLYTKKILEVNNVPCLCKISSTFEIDFLNDNDAIEVKWKDATTDGDHITKEHTRVQVIKNHGYKPIGLCSFIHKEHRQ